MSWFGAWLGSWVGSWFGGGAALEVGTDQGLFTPAPQSPVTTMWTWQTDIHSERDGGERRTSLITWPRERVTFDYILDEDDLRTLRADRWAQTGPEVASLPRWDESLLVTITPTDATITVGTTTLSDWVAEVGQEVIVIGPAGDAYVGGITSSPATPITLDVPPGAGTYTAGQTRVYPLASVNAADGLSIGRWPVNVGRYKFVGDVATFQIEWGAGATLDELGGRPILTSIPLGNDPADETFSHHTDRVDFGAVYDVSYGSERAQIVRAHAFRIAGDAERQWWKLFLATVRGRWGSFWLPTWRSDLELDSQPVDEFLVVSTTETPNYVTTWWLNEAHRALQLELEDGTLLYREVVAATDNLDGTATLELDDPVDTGSLGDVTVVSLMEKCRLSSDDVEIVHEPAVAHLRLSAIVLVDVEA